MERRLPRTARLIAPFGFTQGNAKASLADFAKDLLASRRGDTLDEAQADAAIASLDQPNDDERVGRWIRGFLEGSG